MPKNGEGKPAPVPLIPRIVLQISVCSRAISGSLSLFTCSENMLRYGRYARPFRGAERCCWRNGQQSDRKRADEEQRFLGSLGIVRFN